MSTEIYCNRFERTELAFIPRQLLELAFNDLTATSLHGEIPDHLPRCRLFESLSISVTEAGASGFVVSRPSTDSELYEALLHVLRHEGVVAYAPGSAPIVGNPATIAHLPVSMLVSLGPPILASTSAELAAGLFAH